MQLVAGLGNPGPRYEQTRHNVGFMVADVLARRWNAGAYRFERKFEALVGEGMLGEQRVLLVKPQTYMNLSGRSVAGVVRFYKVPLEDLLVVYDDLDLPLGALRLRAVGSAGGHRGLNDVLLRLGTADVPRLRIGIGKVHRSATVEHVLNRFSPQEREQMDETIAAAADAAECWAREGIDAAMTRFNQRPKPGDG